MTHVLPTGTKAETEDRARAEDGAASAANKGAPKPNPKKSLWERIKRDKIMLLLVLPGFLFFVVFHYIPLLGNIVAFEDYKPYLGFIDSAWVGLENFTGMLDDPLFWAALRNTLVITFLQLVLFFPLPIILALLLNSILSSKFKRFVQSVVYLPHFIGWVIIVSIFVQIFGATGLIPTLFDQWGWGRPNIMNSPEFYPFMLTLQTIWKDTGWGTIIFLAALLNIDPNLYEAAAIDGANKWWRFWTVTLPGILPVVILLLILNLGGILSVGFEQIILQRPFVGAEAGDVLDTYVYFNGIQGGNWGMATAVGLVKGVIGTILVLGANKLAHLFGQEGIYSRGNR
ncbi:ABC transporter permease [Haematomicrobium sanguinis]|uniref:ABC transporter permease n=1 Tax=Haematomicrobium sanguinis TaxID=479106 RepID=UPI000A651B90|nr:ABC transporter permease subunit [Haematomicrobium sanguinis]